MSDQVTDERPALYCGTYGKYNGGSIQGKWMHLEDYEDGEAFLTACAELHKDEDDPEFMFQDYEYLPRELYGESLGTSDLDRIYEWLALDEDDREIVADYWDNVDSSVDPDTARDCYEGNIEDHKGDDHFMSNDVAYGWYVIESGLMGDIPDHLVNYIDVEAVGREYSQDITITDNGNIFGSR